MIKYVSHMYNKKFLANNRSRNCILRFYLACLIGETDIVFPATFGTMLAVANSGRPPRLATLVAFLALSAYRREMVSLSQ